MQPRRNQVKVSEIKDKGTALSLVLLNRNVISIENLQEILNRFTELDRRTLIRAYGENGYKDGNRDRLIAIFAAMKTDDIQYAVSVTGVDIGIAMLAAELYPFKAEAILKMRGRSGEDCLKLAEALAKSTGKEEVIEKAILDLYDTCPLRVIDIAKIDPRFKTVLAEISPQSGASIAKEFRPDALGIGMLSPEHAVLIAKEFPELEAQLQEHFKIES
jgi:hypothetical protein